MAAVASNQSLLEEFRSPTLSPPLLQSLLHKLLSHPKIHNGFIDVLHLPGVKDALSKMDDDKKRSQIVETVKLFAFGTVEDYYRLREKDEVWPLKDAQLEKLRMLSVVSVAQSQIEELHNNQQSDSDVVMSDAAAAASTKKKSKKKKPRDGSVLSIPYAALAARLRIPEDGGAYDESRHVRTLEDLLVRCVYSNVIAGRLDQSSRSFRIDPAASLVRSEGGGSGKKKADACGSLLPRDVDTSSPESARAEAGRMASVLRSFLSRSETLLDTLERAAGTAAADRAEDEARWRNVARAVEEAPAKIRDGLPGGAMDVAALGGDPTGVAGIVHHSRKVKRSKGGDGWGDRRF